MQTKWMNTAAIVAILAGSASSSLAADTNANTLERLEAARIAFEEAKAELEAAQEQYAVETGAAVEVETTNDSSSRAQPADAEPETPADPSSWADGWDWSANVGFNGATGNNENFSARMSIGGKRATSKYETTLGLSYIYGSSEGEKNSSRGQFDLRNDWLTEGKWRYFAEGKYEYDEFQAWDHRVSGAVGVGYEFIDDDKQTLIGRVGLGGSYEFGDNADEEFVPEGLLGLDWTYRLSENTTFNASTTYYPNFDDFGEFRWNNNVGLEVVMDAETGMTLNTGFEHRHDSDPGSGIKSNDLDYYMGLGWKF